MQQHLPNANIPQVTHSFTEKGKPKLVDLNTKYSVFFLDFWSTKIPLKKYTGFQTQKPSVLTLDYSLLKVCKSSEKDHDRNVSLLNYSFSL